MNEETNGLTSGKGSLGMEAAEYPLQAELRISLGGFRSLSML